LRESHAAVEALGARVIAVGTGSAAQARRLMEAGIPFACLVDPEARIHETLGLGRVSWRTLLAPAMYLNYWRGWRRGARQGRITGDPRRLSGVAVLDAAGRLRWRYAARTIGDYPPIARVLTEVQRLA
jgi:hypothetical protein